MPIPERKSGESKESFIDRCMGDAVMTEEYPDRDQRLAVCENKAASNNKAVDKPVHVENKTASNYSIRTETLEGREHWVVPVTFLVEGVHCGSFGCLYYDRELLQNTAHQWNGVPVPVIHPYDTNGDPLPTCNDPAVINRQNVGRLFNVRSIRNKLKGELWFDVERLKAVDIELYNRVKDGEMIEVSTGLTLHQITQDGGIWNNENYEAQTVAYHADHLAVLPNQRGACSLEDGCGIRNREGGDSVDGDMNRENGTTGKVKEWLKGLFSGFSGLALNASEVSYTDLIQKIQQHLDTMDTDSQKYYLRELFQSSVIYEVSPGEMAPSGSESHLYKADFNVGEDGNIELSNVQEVRLEQNFVPVENEQEEKENDDEKQTGGDVKLSDKTANNKKGELIQAVIDCPCSQWNKDDRETLEGFSEDALVKMQFVENKAEEKDAPVEHVDNESVDNYLKSAPAEIRDVISSGIRLHNQKKAELTERILKAEGSTFTKESLQNKSMEDLEGIASLIRDVPKSPAMNYAGNAGIQLVENSDDEDEPLAIPEASLCREAKK